MDVNNVYLANKIPIVTTRRLETNKEAIKTKVYVRVAIY